MKKRLMALVLCLTVMMTMFAPLANATEEDLLSTPTPAPVAATVEPQAESAHESAAPTEAHTEQPSAQPAETAGQEVTAAPVETAASPVEEAVSGMIAVTTGSDVNLRTAPGKDSESLGKIAQSGTAVKPLKKVTLPGGEVWYAVEYEGCTGYIFGDLLTLSAAPAAAETPAAAATPETQETPAPVITEPDAVYTYEFSNTTSEVIYGYEATATLGQSVSVPRNGRVVLSGPAGQWQILVGGVWADLAGADTGVALTYALLKNAGSSTRIRCLDAAGNSQGESAVTLTDPVSVAAPAQEPVLKKTPIRAAAPAADVNAGEGEQDNPAPSTYTIIINYQFANGNQAAPSWSAQVATGNTFTQDIQSPVVVGYTPDQETVHVNTSEAKTYTVTYQPAEVDFTVKHYQQNVSNDNYTLVKTETEKGRTESTVGEKLANTYDGFYSLLYDNTTTIAADGSTVVEIYYDRYYYLMNFDLDGGYGVEPIYARYGAKISVSTPTKPGFTFTGWNKEIPESMPVGNTSYKATWEAGESGFTVVFWYENANDDGYSVAGTYKPADVAADTTVKSDDYKNQSFTGRDTEHFTYNAAKAETVTVKGDGSTVLNVYFTRKTYTLTFKNLTCNKEEGWLHQHSANCYKTVRTTIRAKYQADIHGNFPIKKGNNTIWWEVPDECNSFKPGTTLGSIDIMPGENITFYEDSNTSEATLHYYVETLEGENGTYTHDGKNFVLYKDINISKSGYLTYTEEFHDIKGFTQWWSDPEFDKKEQGGKTSEIKTDNYLCYTRNSYNLKFYNYNAEVSGKGGSVQYEASLSSYDFVPEYPDNLEENAYEFAGWYTTAGCYAGSEADLSTMTMPASDVILYAKWIPKTHTVKAYQTKDVLDNSGEPLQTWDKVPHGTAVPNPPEDPKNGGYTFVGWFYVDEKGEEKAFDFSMPVNRDLNLYAKWSSNTLINYTIRYQLENGTEIAPPTTGSALAGSTKTFDAKTGEQLNEGYQSGYFPKVSSHSITADIEDPSKNEFIFVYVQKPEVEYTVRYLDKATGKPVVVDGVPTPDKTVKTRDAVVTETFLQIKGYAPDAYQKRLVLSANEEENVITFWYTKDETHAPVQIIHWVQNIVGDGYTEYQSSTDLNGEIGKTYTGQPLTRDGFTYNADPANPVDGYPALASGKLTAAGLVLNLYYDRNEYPYEFRFLEQGTDKKLAEPVTGSARYQAQVTQTAETIPGYTLVSAENQAINIAIEDPKDVAAKNVKTFYYVENTVMIHYRAVTFDGATLTQSTTGGNVSPADEQVKVLTGTPQGSMPAANENYRFVGWFTDAECTNQLTNPVGAVIWIHEGNKLIPLKPENGFVEVTYYAKFVKQTKVTIEKQVTGNLGDKTREFEFQYSLDGTKWSDTFKLKHGASFTTLEKLDVGATIYVREKAAAGYSTTASHTSGDLDVADDDDYKKVTVTVLDSDKVIFTNNKVTVPDTGVLLDSLPYVVILAVVVLGAALVIVRRRKHRDDD
ncbi:MAG: InlB B-repeat-containing protein [Eubacteriales bacterium]|nr:InlB B-repeat-containing protein [Eubacteriales bacterium]